MRSKFCCSLLAVTLVAVLVVMGCGPAAPGGTEPIVIGYVGNVASPGERPSMDIQKMAVEEINATGGILGRPIMYVVEDGKGQASLSVAAATRMLLGNKALAFFTPGYTEISFPIQEKCVAAYPQYPHIVIQNGGVNVEVTERILKDYDKYKCVFNDFNMAPGHYAWASEVFALVRDVIGAKKIALLIENGGWALPFREGMEKYNLPSWADMAEEEFGLNVVYYEAVPIRVGMPLPIFEAAARSGAECIFYVSSWASDTLTFAKQWCESSAKDIPVVLYGGPSQTYDFWAMTGGKCLGILGMFTEAEIPFTSKTIPLLRKADARGIPLQSNALDAYDDIYFLKAAIEKAGTTDDVEAIIKAMEEVEIEGVTGRMKIVGERVAPWFHSRLMSNVDNPRELVEGYSFSAYVQFRQDGEVSVLWPPRLGEFAHPEEYKAPSELRKEAGWPGY